MKKVNLLNLLRDGKLRADICITGEYSVYNLDTGKGVFKGDCDDFLSKIGVKLMSDYRL